MQIILTQEEIEEAIEAHVRSQIVIAENQKVSIDLKSTRGETGFTAILDIRAAAVTKAKPKPVTRVAVTDKVASHIAARVAEDQAQADEMEASISDTSAESTETEEVDEVAAAIPDAPSEETEEKAEAAEAPKPKAGSIFSFANGAKAGA